MKEEIFKKGIKRRLLSMMLTLAMVLSLMPSMSMTVNAAAVFVKLNKVSINWDGDLYSGAGIKTLIFFDEYVDENPTITPDYISIEQEFRDNGLVTEYFDEGTGNLKAGKSASDFTIHMGAQEIHPNNIWLKMVQEGLDWRISYLRIQFPSDVAGGTYLTYTPHTVTYHYLNKESEPKTEVKWLNPKDVTTSVTPTTSDKPSGKVFEGWYDTTAYAGGSFSGEKYVFGSTIDADVELYAKWDDIPLPGGASWIDDMHTTWWKWDESTKTITFGGEGEIPDYDRFNPSTRPWHSKIDEATAVIFEDGISRIGNYVMYRNGSNSENHSPLLTISLPYTLQSIGENAFFGSNSVTSLTLDIDNLVLEDGAFYGLTNLATLNITGENITIGKNAFKVDDDEDSLNVIAIAGNGVTIGEEAFSCRRPRKIVISADNATLKYGALGYLYHIEEIEFAGSGVTVEDSIFSVGTVLENLTKITFSHTASALSSSAFNGIGPMTVLDFFGMNISNGVSKEDFEVEELKEFYGEFVTAISAGNYSYLSEHEEELLAPYGDPTVELILPLSWNLDPKDETGHFYGGQFKYETDNGGSNPEPKPTPSKSEAAAAPTIPTDYVAERVAEEEAMEVTVVTVDTTQYSKNEETVVPGTSYNLSKFITTKGIVKGIKTAVAAANNAKKDTVEIYTGKPFCFNKEIIKTIQESKKTVVYYFQYKGHIYSVTVPATVDASKVLEKAGFAGPLYVGQQLGTTKLVK